MLNMPFLTLDKYKYILYIICLTNMEKRRENFRANHDTVVW